MGSGLKEKRWILGVSAAAAAAVVVLAVAVRPAGPPRLRVAGETYRVPAREHALAALVSSLNAAARENPVEVTLRLPEGDQRVWVHRANERALTVSVDGLPRPVRWEDLRDEDIAAAAWAAAGSDASRLLVAADFCLAAGLTGECDGILDMAARGPGAAAFASAVGARRTALAQAAPPAAAQDAPGEKDDWYCPAYDAAHTYTSKDSLPAPLKYKWHWKVPQGRVYQVLSSGGKVFVKGMHPNNTPVGVRSGVHNFVLDPETGQQLAEDPEGTSPNDWCFGWPGGTFGGKIYQADDGGPPFCGADVWGPVQIDPLQKMWLTVQHMRVDGPSPGVYCMATGQGVGGKKWWVGIPVNVKDTQTYCEGDGAIGPGVAYVIIQWKVKEAAALKSGLVCYELVTGKERWHVAGDFECVSAGEDFCVVAAKTGALAAYGAADGKIQWTAQAGGRLECHPMVAGNLVRVYDATGMLTTLKITESGGRRSVSGGGSQMLGKYAGPRTVGRQNSCFCFSADGTMYVANGNAVGGMRPGKKSWQWPVPPALQQAVGPLGGPVIARGKLFAVGRSGVICWDTTGAPPKE